MHCYSSCVNVSVFIYHKQLSDATDAQFSPEVDLSNKPWFSPDEEVPTFEVEAREKFGQALASVPTETKKAMGYQLDDTLQECGWHGGVCGPQ